MGHYKHNKHALMLNVHTFEIYCVPCGVEVFNLEQYGTSY